MKLASDSFRSTVVFAFSFTLILRLRFRLGLRSWGGFGAVGILALISIVTFSFLEVLAHKLTGILALAFAFVLPLSLGGRDSRTAAYGARRSFLVDFMAFQKDRTIHAIQKIVE